MSEVRNDHGKKQEKAIRHPPSPMLQNGKQVPATQ